MRSLIGDTLADCWKSIMVNRRFKVGTTNKQVSYKTGQPIGIRTRFDTIALRLHILVQISYIMTLELSPTDMLGMTSTSDKFQKQYEQYVQRCQLFTDYIVLGDDIVIFNKKVSDKYKLLLARIGVDYSPQKTFEGREIGEFASRTYVRIKSKSLSKLHEDENLDDSAGLTNIVEPQIEDLSAIPVKILLRVKESPTLALELLNSGIKRDFDPVFLLNCLLSFGSKKLSLKRFNAIVALIYYDINYNIDRNLASSRDGLNPLLIEKLPGLSHWLNNSNITSELIKKIILNHAMQGILAFEIKVQELIDNKAIGNELTTKLIDEYRNIHPINIVFNETLLKNLSSELSEEDYISSEEKIHTLLELYSITTKPDPYVESVEKASKWKNDPKDKVSAIANSILYKKFILFIEIDSSIREIPHSDIFNRFDQSAKRIVSLSDQVKNLPIKVLLYHKILVRSRRKALKLKKSGKGGNPLRRAGAFTGL
jgi:hypothetical protein